MRNRFSGYKLAFIGLLSLGFGSCERYNTYNNNNVIIKPFSLFVSDSAGLLWNSTDGSNYKLYWTKNVDGKPMRAISTAGNNILFVKDEAFVSTDNGQQFNDIDPSGPIGPASPSFARNQHMVIYPREYQRIYMAGTVGGGMMYSDSFGKINTWVGDYNFAPGIPSGYTIGSYTQLKNNDVYAYSPVDKRLFKKTAKNNAWTEPKGGPIDVGGSSTFYLSHFANSLVIADYAGSGVWHSENGGISWTQYIGLPPGIPYTAVLAPFEQTLLVGTWGQGVFRFDPSSNTFKPANNGIQGTTVVRGIAAKERLYKSQEDNTPTNTNWIFMATNTGVYRSQNNGQDWFLVHPGNYTAIY